MHLPSVIGDLDVVPSPIEISRRLAAAARVQRLLRSLLKVSIQAERERAHSVPAIPNLAPADFPELKVTADAR